MELIDQLIELFKNNVETDPRTIHLMESVYRGNVVAKICTEPQKYNVLISEMITNSKRFNVPLPEVENRVPMTIINHSMQDFEAPKPIPQSAPPADFEIKGQVKDEDPKTPEIFIMSKISPKDLKEQYTLKEFIEKVESLGHNFKNEDLPKLLSRNPKNMDQAIESFTWFFRMKLGI